METKRYTSRIYYRKIILKRLYIFLLAKGQEKTCLCDDVGWKFIMKENGEIELSLKEKEGKNVKILIPTSRSALCREKTFIDITEIFKKEVDGSFYFPEFNLPLHNNNDIKVICNNFTNFNDIHYLI